MERQPRLQESIEQKEYEPSDGAWCTFLNITPETLASIRDRLAGVDGHLRISVHPLYTEQAPGTTYGRLGSSDLTEVQKKLRNAFLRTTESVVRNPDSSPLVVYEVIKTLEKTKAIIADNLSCAVSQLEELGIVFIPTEVGDPSPDLTSLLGALNEGNDSDIEEAEKISSLMKTTNVYIRRIEQRQENMRKAIPGYEDASFHGMSDSERELYFQMRQSSKVEMLPLYQKYIEDRESLNLEKSKLMVSLFRKLGMKSALVSGAYLDVGKNNETEEPRLQACAGTVVNYLREAEFPVDISSNIWPPKELIKEAGLGFKQTHS